ncbi:rhomboid family intramembrane serine protease [Luteolibacter sp. SL250]|uniref:rhomboid family intramembrane serine protease n=1 Tax=Luteolibacter sp. SL250 TaxID=2995170 RepID=UPI00226D5B23|nr:rhomboid family intramembrane serine protease [Luteolibacter sp. SL250]WAC20293.1 rhomboid family intramembrane serine protease [Luteolibacter sp. SL250]
MSNPPSLPPEGYRIPSQNKWFRHGLFLVGMPVEIRQTITVKKPWFTWIFSGLLVLCSIVFWVDPDVWRPLVFHPSSTGLAWWLGAFGYTLLHADPLHLAGNLYFLLIFGNNVECRFGRRRTVGLFFASSVTGAFLHGLANVHPLIGASGGVFGVVTFYALLFPHARILWLPFGWIVNASTLLFGRGFVARGMSVKAFIILYFALQFVLLHQQIFLNGTVSALAHLGGGLAGAVIWWAWKKNWLP